MVVALVSAVVMLGLVCIMALIIMYRILQMKFNGGVLPEIMEKPAILDKFSEILSKKEDISEIDDGTMNTKQDQKAMAEAQDAFSNLMN